MKSAYKRANDFFKNSRLDYTENDVNALKDVLREQDDETRLGCAEAAFEASKSNDVYEACMSTSAA